MSTGAAEDHGCDPQHRGGFRVLRQALGFQVPLQFFF